MGPQIAVIIPTHDRLQYVRELVDSALEQDVPVELVVVDDGSTDGTYDALSRIDDDRLRVVRHARAQERSAARNTGLRTSSAPWVMFVDSDDLLAEGALAALTAGIADAADDVVAVLGALEHFDDATGRAERQSWVRRPWTGDLTADCAVDAFMGCGRVLHRRSNLERAGEWDVALPPHEDWDYSFRTVSGGPVRLIPELVLRKREHANNSNLERANAALQQIRATLRSRDPAAARVVDRRTAALQVVYAEHALGRARLRRFRAATRAFRTDPTMVRTPIGRRTVGLMVVRLVGSAVRP